MATQACMQKKAGATLSGILGDTVLLDMTMPGMNGDEVLRKIRGIRTDVPVIPE